MRFLAIVSIGVIISAMVVVAILVISQQPISVVSESPPMINIYDAADGAEVVELRSDDFVIRCKCPKKGTCEISCTEGQTDVLCPDGFKCRMPE